MLSGPSPRRKLADIGSANTANQKALSKRAEKHTSSNLMIWNSPSRRPIKSPPKRNFASPSFNIAQDASPTNDNSDQTKRTPTKSIKHNLPLTMASPKSPPPRRVQPPPLLHPATSPRRIRLGPRISHGSQPISQSGCSDSSHCSIRDEPKSILHPRGHRLAAAGSASSHDSSSYTMTPMVMFSEEVDHQQIQIGSKRDDQQYHQSPHWTGKVRINPFSPVPQKYLDPPSSTKSLPHLGSYVGFPILSGKSLSPLHLSSQQLGMRRSRRLKPKKESFPSTIMEDNVSPTDVTDDPFGIDMARSPAKRKSSVMLGLPRPNEDMEPAHKQIKLSRSRYLEDFEEVRHLGSGSFGSVNACLSRLDGCTYAIKSVSPKGIQRSNLGGYNPVKCRRDGLYRGRQSSSLTLPQAPPTPRRDVALTPVKKKKRKFKIMSDEPEEDMGGGLAAGTKHWTESALRRMLREVHALAALCGQADVRTFHIVRYHQAWFENDGTLYIQTELCSNTLRDELGTIDNDSSYVAKSLAQSKTKVIDASQRFKCLREILLALQLVHSKGMVHLDIKPENIFVQNGLYKLGDFGLAGIANSMDVEEGDSRYMSREMLEDGKRDLTKCDIFSLGATMYEMCLGRTLPSCGEEWHAIRNGKLTPFWPPSLYSLIRAMMDPDPVKRPSASSLLANEELSCRSGEWLTTANDSVYNVCLKETTPSLRRSLSWTL